MTSHRALTLRITLSVMRQLSDHKRVAAFGMRRFADREHESPAPRYASMRAAAFLFLAACSTAAADPAPATCFEKDLDCYGMTVAQRGDNVVACCGEQCVVVEPASGKVVGTQSIPVSGVDPS